MHKEHFERNFSNRRQIVNIHIPKTAGTTFRAQVTQELPLVAIDLGEAGDDEHLPHYDRLRSILRNAAIRTGDDQDFFASGHFRYRDLQSARPDLAGKVSITTFLRNPIDRMLSDYYYSISEVHPGSEDFLRSYPTFEIYMRSPGQANKQLEYLQADHEDSIEQTLDRIQREFAFVGVTETYDVCKAWFFDQLGAPQPPSAHLNRNLNRHKISDERKRHADELREILRPEFRLYNFFKDVWMPD